jgi:hypothetical protein
MRTRRRIGAAACTLAVLAVVCGCTTSGKPSARQGTPAASIGSAAESAAPSGTPSITDSGPPAPSSTAAATTSRPAVTHSVTQPALPRDTCLLDQLSVRVIPGGAVPGREIAAITFTNTSGVACSMVGFPGVSLRLAGKLVGSPAVRSSTPIKTVHLAPNGQAQAVVSDFSTCQAPLSDTVRIYPPNLTQYVDRPFQLRACRLQVDPVTPS